MRKIFASKEEVSMYSWFLIALTIIFAVIVAKLILKKYNAYSSHPVW